MLSQLANIKEVGHCLIEQFEYALLGEQVDVRGPADEAVDVLGRIEVEVDVYPVDDLLPDYAVDHLPLQFAAAVALVRVADARGVPGDVAVLAAAQQDDLLEVLEVAALAQLVQEGVLERLGVLHGQLVETLHLVHLAHEPQARLDHGVHPVQVAEVGSAEGEEEAELLVELGEVAEAGPRDDASHAVAHEVDDGLGRVFVVALDGQPHLVCQSQPHHLDVGVGVHLVVGGAVDECGGQHLADLPLEHLHVEGTGLEAVAEEDHHVPLVVAVPFLHLGLPEVGQLPQHLLDRALLVLLGLEGVRQVDFHEGVVLVLLAAEEVLVDDLLLADALLLPQLARQLGRLLLVGHLLAEHQVPDQPLPEEVLPLCPVLLLHLLEVDVCPGDVLGHGLEEVEVFLVDLVDVLPDELFSDGCGLVVGHVFEEFLVTDHYELPVFPLRDLQLDILLAVAQEVLELGTKHH